MITDNSSIERSIEGSLEPKDISVKQISCSEDIGIIRWNSNKKKNKFLRDTNAG